MSKNSYFIIALVVVLVVVGGAILIEKNKNQAVAPTTEVSQVVNDASKTNGESVSSSVAPSPANNVVTYTNSGYSPSVLSVKLGATVVFKNESSEPMWTASDVHPTHTGYDGTSLREHCANSTSSTFDECRADPPGSLWSFTFNKVGTWGYHNHRDAGMIGTIIVSQ